MILIKSNTGSKILQSTLTYFGALSIFVIANCSAKPMEPDLQSAILLEDLGVNVCFADLYLKSEEPLESLFEVSQNISACEWRHEDGRDFLLTYWEGSNDTCSLESRREFLPSGIGIRPSSYANERDDFWDICTGAKLLEFETQSGKGIHTGDQVYPKLCYSAVPVSTDQSSFILPNQQLYKLVSLKSKFGLPIKAMAITDGKVDFFLSDGQGPWGDDIDAVVQRASLSLGVELNSEDCVR